MTIPGRRKRSPGSGALRAPLTKGGREVLVLLRASADDSLDVFNGEEADRRSAAESATCDKLSRVANKGMVAGKACSGCYPEGTVALLRPGLGTHE